MTSINAGGAFYRVQNELNQNSNRLSQSMQRLASGQQNIAPGDRTGSSAVAFSMKAESASLKIGLMNGTEALQSIEMVTNDLAQMNDIVVRLEEIHALGTNAFNTSEDTAALTAEANNLLTEMTRIASDAKWKGTGIIKQNSTDTTTNTMNFGRNAATIDVVLDAFEIPEVALGFNTIGDEIYGQIDVSAGRSELGTAYNLDTTTDPANPVWDSPQTIAARSAVVTGTSGDSFTSGVVTLTDYDSKVHDRTAQSKLEINGAVYFEHLTAAGQASLTTTTLADDDAIMLTTGESGLAADAAGYSVEAAVAENGSLILLTTGIDNQKAVEDRNHFGRQVVITSTGDESTAQFTITGIDMDDNVLIETITGGNAGSVTSDNFFKSITSIDGVGNTGEKVKAGSGAKTSLVLNGALGSADDNSVFIGDGKQVTISSTADNSGVKYQVTGTDKNDKIISEEITGPAAAASVTGVLFFKSITKIETDITVKGMTEIGTHSKVASGPKELGGSDIGSGSAEGSIALSDLKAVVDKLNINAGTLFNKVSNVMSHMGSLNAGYQLDVASKMDVDFAGETANLAKGQILAQAGTAMLAQANAQQQGMLALLQS